MGEGSAGVVWFAAPGFRLLAVNDDELDVVIEIESDAVRVGCPQCGVIARAKDRRWGLYALNLGRARCLVTG